MASLRVAEIEGKGRGLVSARPLTGGEVVLTDSPILLYSALQTPQSDSYCSHCFAKAPPHARHRCHTCVASFCSPTCAAAHHAPACASRARLLCHNLDHDLLLQARFLIAAYNLSDADFQSLLSLQGSPDQSAVSAAKFLHSLDILSDVHRSVSVELSAMLLAKDKANAFGLMEPFEETEGRRSVRAYGVYPNAALFNHDCLPNACRFDYPDNGGPEITVRMIHDVPKGREICLSYFPVNAKFADRQKRLKEDYGFCCDCDRCKVEADWSDQEEEEEEEDMEMEEEEEEEEEEVEVEEDGADMEEASTSAFPHAYFFARYMCERENCHGTLAPLPKHHPSASSDNGVAVMECNVCANLSSAPQH